MTKEEALRLGAKHYMGPPCKSGHSGERHTVDNSCCQCRMIATKERRAANPGAEARSRRRYKPKEVSRAAPLIATSDFIAPITLSRLMAGR